MICMSNESIRMLTFEITCYKIQPILTQSQPVAATIGATLLLNLVLLKNSSFTRLSLSNFDEGLICIE